MLSNFISGIPNIAVFLMEKISALAVIFLTLPIHEWAHGFTAVKLGDDTPRWQGRLTLNPLAHIDLIGALCILLFGFGWAKPVQVNEYNFKNPKRDMAITAFAGPLSNLVVALVFLILSNIIKIVFLKTNTTVLPYFCNFVFMVAKINVSLAVFNLLPVPPLDGSRLLAVFLPNGIYYKIIRIMRYEKYIFIALFALLYMNILSVPLAYITNEVFNGLYFLAGLPFKFL